MAMTRPNVLALLTLVCLMALVSQGEAQHEDQTLAQSGAEDGLQLGEDAQATTGGPFRRRRPTPPPAPPPTPPPTAVAATRRRGIYADQSITISECAKHGNSGLLTFTVGAVTTPCARRRGPNIVAPLVKATLGSATSGTHPDTWTQTVDRDLCLDKAAEQIALWNSGLTDSLVLKNKNTCEYDLVTKYKTHYGAAAQQTSGTCAPQNNTNIHEWRNQRRLLAGTTRRRDVNSKYQRYSIGADGAKFQDNPFGPEPTGARRRTYQRIGPGYRGFDCTMSFQSNGPAASTCTCTLGC